MSDYHLCDTCAVWHINCGEESMYCKERNIVRKHTASDDKAPREVCPKWEPKEEV